MLNLGSENVGDIISGLTFLCPLKLIFSRRILSDQKIKEQLTIWGMEKLLTPVTKVKESPGIRD